jgi:hypothetical protein
LEDLIGLTTKHLKKGQAHQDRWAGRFRKDPPDGHDQRHLSKESEVAKKRKRIAWSAEHVRTLKSMAKKKVPAGKIAKTLKRTEGATRQKAFSMGLSLDSRE